MVVLLLVAVVAGLLASLCMAATVEAGWGVPAVSTAAEPPPGTLADPPWGWFTRFVGWVSLIVYVLAATAALTGEVVWRVLVHIL
ncbi:MAG: hypothetical protein IMX01_02665 [Limnochordaceae bacterium]|nr:hypothetical protein [Limnochordaceae bacterium]